MFLEEAPLSEKERGLVKKSPVLDTFIAPIPGLESLDVLNADIRKALESLNVWSTNLEETLRNGERPLKERLGEIPYQILIGSLIEQARIMTVFDENVSLKQLFGVTRTLFLTGYELADEAIGDLFKERVPVRLANLGVMKNQYHPQQGEDSEVAHYLTSLGRMGQVYGNMHKYEAQLAGRPTKPLEELLKDLDLGEL